MKKKLILAATLLSTCTLIASVAMVGSFNNEFAMGAGDVHYYTVLMKYDYEFTEIHLDEYDTSIYGARIHVKKPEAIHPREDEFYDVDSVDYMDEYDFGTFYRGNVSDCSTSTESLLNITANFNSVSFVFHIVNYATFNLEESLVYVSTDDGVNDFKVNFVRHTAYYLPADETYYRAYVDFSGKTGEYNIDHIKLVFSCMS